MNRWSFVVVALAVAVAATSSCNSPICGAGTKQVQQADGTLKCELADSTSGPPCDVDGGASIVGGRCVSAISCGAGTKLNPVTNQCESSGGGGTVCSAPTSGNFCINGTLLNFVDNTPNTTAQVHVSIYNALDLLNGGGPLDKGDFTGSYLFPNVPAPSLGLIAIVVGDANGMNTTFVNCASGDQGIANGNKYHVDAFVLPRTVTDMWKTQGIDIATGGAYVAKFFNDPKPPSTNLVANETHPVAGVTLLKDGAAAAGAKYFGASLTMFDGTLTATNATTGAAIVASPVVGGAFPTFSGMGPTAMPITWESEAGGSAAGLVVVSRFHPNM